MFTDHSGQRERVKAGEGDDRGWDSWMASPTLWTWVWASSRSWWWTGKPGVHSPWGCKESDMTEWLNWTWKRIFGGEGGYINSKSAGYNWGTGGCGAGGAGEEESLSEVHPSWQVYYLRIRTVSYLALSTTNTVQATHVTWISLVTTLKKQN